MNARVFIFSVILMQFFITKGYTQNVDKLYQQLKIEYEELDYFNLSLKKPLSSKIDNVKKRIAYLKKELKTSETHSYNPVYFDNNIELDYNLDLVDFYVYEYSDDYYSVIGRLKNKRRKYLEWVKIIFNFYNNGSFIGTDFTYTDFDTYGYNGISPYKYSFIDTFCDKADFDSVSFEAIYDEESGNDDILWDQILNLESVLIQPYFNNYHKWQGTVRNQFNYSMKFVKIIACILKDGKMIGTDFTFLDIESIGYDNVIIYSVTTTPTSEEQITLKNFHDSDIDLSGWTLGDLNDSTAYRIPQGTIIYSGLTKKFTHTQLGFQINDTGEVIYLKDNLGNTIDIWDESIGQERENLFDRFNPNSSASFDSYIDLPDVYDEIKYYLTYSLYSLEGEGNIPPNCPIFTQLSYSGYERSNLNFEVFVIDHERDQCYLLIDFGDDAPFTWLGSFISGYNANIKHAYSQEGEYFIIAKAKDPSDSETSWSDTVNINILNSTKPQITTLNLDSAYYKKQYLDQLSATGGIQPYTWQIVTGILPNGLTLNAEDGTISGFPIKSGLFEFLIAIADAGVPSLSDTTEYSIFVINNPPVITSDDTVTVYTNTQLTYIAQATDPDANTVSFEFVDYPSWLSKTNTTLYGTTPDVPQDTSFKLIATDGDLGDTSIVKIKIIEQTSIQVYKNNNIPSIFFLSQSYPNPFNPNTKIKFGIPKRSNVNIYIFDLNGRLVEELYDGNLNAGTYEFDWYAFNLPSGTYFINMIASDFSEIRKCVLLK